MLYIYNLQNPNSGLPQEQMPGSCEYRASQGKWVQKEAFSILSGLQKTSNDGVPPEGPNNASNDATDPLS